MPSVIDDVSPVSEQRKKESRSLLPNEEQPCHRSLRGAAGSGKGDQDEVSHYY